MLLDATTLLSGNASHDCALIEWDNGSSWARMKPINRVHMIFMNHLGECNSSLLLNLSGYAPLTDRPFADVGYNGIPTVGYINNVLNYN